MIKLLGLIDISAALILAISLFDLKWNILFIIVVICLFLKGMIFLIFSKDFASVIDIFSSAIILLMLFIDVPSFLTIIIGVLLLQKGIFSLF